MFKKSLIFFFSAVGIFLGGLWFFSQYSEPLYLIARSTDGYENSLMGQERVILALSDELLGQIALSEDYALSLISTSHNKLLSGLESGLYDAIVLETTGREPLHPNLLFSETFFDLGPSLLVPFNSPYNSLSEMKGKTVGILKDSPLLMVSLAAYKDISFVSLENEWRGFEGLSNNKIDGFIMDALPGFLYREKLYRGKVKIISPPLLDLGLKLVALNTPRGTELIEKFNAGLAQMEESGDYEKLFDKWGFKDYPIDFNH